MRYAYPNELYHYGIHGMKWGVRRFQNPDGTLTAAGRRRYGSIENLQAGVTKKQIAKKQKAIQQAETQKAQHELDRQKALQSGSAADVLKFQGELTNDELNKAINRIKYEKQLKSIADEDVMTGEKAIAKMNDVMKKTSDFVFNASSLYDNVAKVVNSFGGDLPRIDGDSQKRFKEQEKAAKDAEFEKLLRTKDVSWFADEKNIKNFSTDELDKVAKRYAKLKDVKSKADNSKKDSGNKQTEKDSSKKENEGAKNESGKSEKKEKKAKSSVDNSWSKEGDSGFVSNGPLPLNRMKTPDKTEQYRAPVSMNYVGPLAKGQTRSANTRLTEMRGERAVKTSGVMSTSWSAKEVESLSESGIQYTNWLLDELDKK